MPRYAIKIVIGAGLLAATLWWSSPTQLVSTLARADATAALAVLAVGVQIALAGERWRLLVGSAGSTMDLRSGLRIGFVASLSGQFLPGGVEIARIGMGRLNGIPWSRLVSLALLDRVLLTGALVATAACGLAVVAPALRPLLLTALLGGLAAAVLGLWLAVTHRLGRLLPPRLLHALRSVVGVDGARPWLFAAAGGLALLTPVNLAFAAWILAGSMQIDLSLVSAITWIPLVLAAGTLPVSLGGWGVREAAAVALLGQVGVPASEALALSIGLGVASLVAALPGAFMMPTDWRRASHQ